MVRIVVDGVEVDLPPDMADLAAIWEKAVEEGVDSLSHEELSELLRGISRLMRSSREDRRRAARIMDEYIRERLDEAAIKKILMRRAVG